MSNVIAGPWAFAQERAQGSEGTRSPRVVKEKITTIPSSLRLPVKSGVISDTLFEKWVELLRLCGDEKSWYWTLTADDVRYKIRFYSLRDEIPKTYGWLGVFHANSGVKRVHVRTSSADDHLEYEVKEAANSNVEKLLKGRISREFEDEMIAELENQLGYLDQSTSHKSKYGEHLIAHKLRWWNLIHRSELTRQRIQG